ncbi:MAG TPA: RHS repeat-associated core domain-containing protein [Caulobacter sp.]|nr:RHS repeat-associated core domain-containing protein [Caulobacter sp.]
MKRLLAVAAMAAGVGLCQSASAETIISVTQFKYDVNQRPQCVAVRMNPDAFGGQPDACVPGTPGTDGPDRITFTEYDAAGQVKKVTSGYGVAPQVDKEVVEYTDNGLERIVADGKGNRTTYEYDGFDRLKKVRYPNAVCCASSDTDFEEYAYDANGNRTSWRRRFEASPVIFTYDALNRAQNGLRGEAYGYDNLGHRTSATFAGGTASATFDALGQMKSETTNGRTINYEYDPAGNRTKMAWPDGFAALYERNATGAITFVKEKQTPTAGLVTLATYGYDDLGRIKSLARPNGLTTSYGYDAVSRLTCLSHAADCSSLSTGKTWTFTYNAASQVRSREASDARYEWPGAHTSKTYETNGLNQYAKIGAVNYRYGGRGNLTCDAFNTTSGACEGTSYGYDLVNNLTTVTVGGATKTLGYEPTGRLELVSGTTTTRLLYAGSDVVAEYDGAGALLRRYVPGPGTDAPIVWYEGSGTADRRWLLADPQGSIVAVTNGSGTSIFTNTYDEYGVPGPSNQGLFQYTGQIWLPEVGLYHYKARAYSPTLGRFLQTDPTGYDDGLNWYAYTGNDPVNGSDPTGLQAMPGQRPIGCGFSGCEAERRNFTQCGSPFGCAANDNDKGKGNSGRVGPLAALGAAIGSAINHAGFNAAVRRAHKLQAGGDPERRYNIVYHYTDYPGALGISLSQMIKPDARKRTYITMEAMGPDEARDKLFIGGNGRPDRGSYVVIVALPMGYPMRADPSTNQFGSGFYTTGPIRNSPGVVGPQFLYNGPNYIPNSAAWDLP